MRKEFALIVYTVINEYSIFITQYTSSSLASAKGKIPFHAVKKLLAGDNARRVPTFTEVVVGACAAQVACAPTRGLSF